MSKFVWSNWKPHGTLWWMIQCFVENLQAVKVTMTYQSVAELFIQKGHCILPFRMKKVILWRMNLSGQISYVCLTLRTNWAGTVDTLTVISFQNCQEDESSCVETTLRNTKKTHSARRGRSHGFDRTYGTSLLLPSQNNQHQTNNERKKCPPHNLLIVLFVGDGRW